MATMARYPATTYRIPTPIREALADLAQSADPPETETVALLLAIIERVERRDGKQRDDLRGHLPRRGRPKSVE